MALTAATRSSSESIRVPSRSKMMSLIFLSGSGRNVRIIPFQYSDVTFFWTCHDGPSEASALFFGAKAKKSPLVVAGQFPSTRRSGSYHVIGSNQSHDSFRIVGYSEIDQLRRAGISWLSRGRREQMPRWARHDKSKKMLHRYTGRE